MLAIVTMLISSFSGVILSLGQLHAEENTRNHTVYLAGPLGFSEAGRLFMYSKLIPALEEKGYTVLDPWQSTDESSIEIAKSLAYGDARRQAWVALNRIIGAANIKLMQSANVMVAVLDGPDVDSGTASEIGYFQASGKTIYGYRGDFRLSSDNEGSIINLQVEQFILKSGGRIAGDLKDLLEIVPQSGLDSKSQNTQNLIQSAQTQKPTVHPNAQRLVDFLERTISILFALAFGEAFKQFVSDRGESNNKIHWDRLPALISFLSLFLAFFHGATRFVDDNYVFNAPLNPSYAKWISIDVANFLTEAALFFMMSRALSTELWERFYTEVMALLVVDSVWGIHLLYVGRTAIYSWIVLNIITFAILAATRTLPASLRARFSWREVSFLSALMVLRTCADYYWNWEWYFLL